MLNFSHWSNGLCKAYLFENDVNCLVLSSFLREDEEVMGELLKGYVLSILDADCFLEHMEVLYSHEERHRFA